MTRCICCDLPLSSCGAEVERRQRGEERAERARLLGTPGAFLARYAGPCAGCGEYFREGDPIVRAVLAGQYRSLLCCEAAR